MTLRDPQLLGSLMMQMAHDLRNPAAALGTNLVFVTEAVQRGEYGDLGEALADIKLSLADMNQGLMHLATIASAIVGERTQQPVDGDVVAAVKIFAAKKHEVPLVLSTSATPLKAHGANLVASLLDIFVADANTHAPGETVTIRVFADGDFVVVEHEDRGPALAQEFRSTAFAPEGQAKIKNRSDGRYARCLGLLAARLTAETMGAAIEADGTDGAACFRIRLKKGGI